MWGKEKNDKSETMIMFYGVVQHLLSEEKVVLNLRLIVLNMMKV